MRKQEFSKKFKNAIKIASVTSFFVLTYCNFSAAAILGDINNDGKCTTQDATLLKNYLVQKQALTKDQLSAADLNGDWKITITDLSLLKEKINNPSEDSGNGSTENPDDSTDGTGSGSTGGSTEDSTGDSDQDSTGENTGSGSTENPDDSTGDSTSGSLEGKNVVRIEVDSLPDKTRYIRGEEFEQAGLVIVAVCDDGERVDITGEVTLSGFSSKKLGSQVITVSFDGKVTSFKVSVGVKMFYMQKDVVMGIEIVTMPTKTIYKYGESLDLTGLTLLKRWISGNTENVSSYTVTGYNPYELGKQKLTITYIQTDEDGQVTKYTTKLTVEVIDYIEEFIVEENKTVYKYGEDFDYTVTAVYASGEEEDLSNFVEIVGYDPNTLGEQTVTVKYTEALKNGEVNNFEEEVTVEVINYITAFNITLNKDVYKYGEDLDYTAEVVYADGETVDATADTNITTNYDNTILGTQTVEFKYTENLEAIDETNEFTVTADVNVVDYINNIEVTSLPTKLEYVEGQDIDLTGLVVTANYASGATLDVTDSAVVDGFNSSVVGPCTLTVTYTEYIAELDETVTHTVTFDIEIIARAIESIAVATEPTKKVYALGEELDLTGGVITLVYNDASTETLDMTADGVTTEGYDNTIVRTQTIIVKYQGLETSFEIDTYKIEVTPPTKTQYYIGEELDLTGGSITITYWDGTAEATQTIAMTTEGIVATFDNTTAGTKVVTLEYNGYTVTFDVEVIDYITGLEITTLPTKLEYIVGDTLDLTGLQVMANYASGTQTDVTANTSASEFDSSVAGTKTITITYVVSDTESYSVTFDVIVNESALASIAVATEPTKTSYLVGEELDLTGGTLTLTYDNGDTKTIDMTAAGVTVEGFEKDVFETFTITVTYQEKTTTFEVTTYRYELTPPTKTEYYIGEELDLTGGSLYKEYANQGGASTVVLTEDLVSGYDNTKEGTQTLTVRYDDFEGTFEVVVYDYITGISVTTLPTKTEYYVGEELDLTGLVVTAEYASVKIINVADNCETSGFDSSVPGTCTITVTYKENRPIEGEVREHTATFDVTVNAIVDATGITLDAMMAEIDKDATMQLTATVTPEDATNKNVIWTSSDETIATVDQTGLVTGQGVEGEVTITAALEENPDIYATCVVRLSERTITGAASITLDKTEMTLEVGETDTINATIAPAGMPEENIAWTSSDESVATVDDNGVVTAIGEGNATITIIVTLAGVEYTETCEVTVNAATIPVTGITLNAMVAEMDKDATMQLTATVTPEDATNKNVIWTSSDEQVATVDQTGLVTGLGKEGEVTITATSEENPDIYATCVIELSERTITGAASITLDKTEMTLEVGETDTINATIAPAGMPEENIAWTSSDESVATVDDNGVVTAIGEGNATITIIVTLAGVEYTEACEVTVNAIVDATGITLNAMVAEMDKDATMQLTATVTPEDATNKNVIWTSSDESVATVDQTGLVTGLGKEGEVTITATLEENPDIYATCSIKLSERTITGTIPVIGITLNAMIAEMDKDATMQLTATVTPEGATNKNVIWTSSDESVATVDQTGLVTGLGKEGEVTITATSESDSDIYATCTITLKELTITGAASITLDKTEMTLEVGETDTINATIAPAGMPEENIAWTSSDESVATVDDNGVVTAIGEGNATITITVTLADVEYTETCEVTVEKATIAVTGVTLNVTELTLVEGKNETIVATIDPENATNKTLIWSSTNDSVATVDDNGKVIAISAGTATIIVTTEDGEITAYCTVTVNAKAVESYNFTAPTKRNYVVDQDDLDLTGGTLSITYNDGTSEEIDMAEKADEMEITGFDKTTVGEQEVTIRYNVLNGTIVAKYNVFVDYPVGLQIDGVEAAEEIVLDADTGETVTMRVLGFDYQNVAVKLSAEADIMSLSETDNTDNKIEYEITGTEKGKTTLTVTVVSKNEDGSEGAELATFEKDITVTKTVDMSFDKESIELGQDETTTLTIQGLPSVGASWKLSYPSFLSVSQIGVSGQYNIRSLERGTGEIVATITFTDNEVVTLTCPVTVDYPVSLSLDKTEVELTAGESTTVTVNGLPTYGEFSASISYSAPNNEITVEDGETFGVFEITANSATTEDIIVYITITVDGVEYPLQTTVKVNGLIATLTTDEVLRHNTEYLQNWIDETSEAGGGTVVIPAGTYYFGMGGTRPGVSEYAIKCKDNVKVVGAGVSATQNTTLIPYGAMSLSTGGRDMFYFNDYGEGNGANYLVNADFADFIIDGNYITGGSYNSSGKGFMINLCEDCDWDNVVVKNTYGTGFGMDCVINCTINNCYAENCGRMATTSDVGASGFGIGAGYSNEESMTITNCRSVGNTKYGFFFEHQARFNSSFDRYPAQSGNFVVSNCTASGNYADFGGERAYDVTYKNCKSDDTYGTPISSFHFENVSVRSKFENCSTDFMFTDAVETAYYYDAAVWALNNGIVEGNENWELEPASEISRATAVRILWRMDGRDGDIIYGGTDALKESQIVTGFTDVPGSAAYATAVNWAVGEGITNGISDTEFAPDDICSRASFITYLYRYAGSPEVTIGNIDTIFTDVNTEAFYAKAVRWAYDNGIITGTEGGTFAPSDACQKGAAITMMYRYAN